MPRAILRLAAVAALAIATAAEANIYVEHSFQQKMKEADVVFVGTVLTVQPGTPGQLDATATVAPVAMIKGAPQASFVVHTQSRAPEEGVAQACCEVGSTYMMFLKRTGDGASFASINGRFGLIRVGPARDEPEIKVLPYRGQ